MSLWLELFPKVKSGSQEKKMCQGRLEWPIPAPEVAKNLVVWVGGLRLGLESFL